ncbi:VOC family protein [Pseudalkalibacillus hwajinpoensis]|uniref:VOC family protein n=1 Tax=Guptibacillus hwajinpoensis TaxID=208199 RepID=A0A4U1MEW0_9BACL|nr:VOC family protein [Pseudalkalibacillus hwajinpoensis]TKD69231.1 VOC family protein [Pseudalkalibacillus hwajinpoensis]
MKFNEFSAAQVRIARPTEKLDKVVEFYEEGLGLKKITEFSGHKGYKGVILGLPNTDYHLEFTSHDNGSPCPAPSLDNLLVFYISNKEEINNLAQRLNRLGYKEVEPENEYWKEKGVTVEDPDGWRIVLMNTNGV